jgi:hypothetical protein
VMALGTDVTEPAQTSRRTFDHRVLLIIAIAQE